MMSADGGDSAVPSIYSDGEKSVKSSKNIEVVAERLREASPDPTSLKDGRGGASRRKPKVTRKVIDTDDDALDSEDLASKDANGVDNMETDQNVSLNEEEDIDIDEDGNPILPEGTVVVQPEAVQEKKPKFQGPEFSPRKRQIQDDKLETIHCTACNRQINHHIANSVKKHPVLKVVICKKCYTWYTSDEIDQDSNGMDEQCRWCGDGGNLYCCDYCHNAFCKSCIKRNLGRTEFSKIENADENDKWHCYVCHQKPLKKLQIECESILEAVEKAAKKKKVPTATLR